jgi:effector-binding domain-containing protein
MSYDIQPEELPARLTLVKRAHPPVHETGRWLHRTYQELFDYLARQDVAVTGPPFARYAFGEGFGVEAGFPVAAPVHGEGGIVMSSLPPTRAATTLHTGPYERLGDAYDALEKWIADHGQERNGLHWEVYLTDPETEPDPRRYQTIVVMPFRSPAAV